MSKEFKVLIVDDDKENQAVISELLEFTTLTLILQTTVSKPWTIS